MPLADFGPDECGMLIRHTIFDPPPRLRPFPIGMLDFEHRIVSDPLVMPRTATVAPGGFVYHVLNRFVGKMHIRYVERNP
jgi:hypothetical protein